MKKSSLILILFLLVSCSVHYGPRVPGFIPGYEDKQLESNTYQVKIGQAWPKDWPDLEKFALYRAAEITKQNEKNYFAIIEASTQIDSYTVGPFIMRKTTETIPHSLGKTASSDSNVTNTSSDSQIKGGWYYIKFLIISNDEIDNFARVVNADKVIVDLKDFIDKRR